MESPPSEFSFTLTVERTTTKQTSGVDPGFLNSMDGHIVGLKTANCSSVLECFVAKTKKQS
jgi:hypothetical protein